MRIGENEDDTNNRNSKQKLQEPEKILVTFFGNSEVKMSLDMENGIC